MTRYRAVVLMALALFVAVAWCGRSRDRSESHAIARPFASGGHVPSHEPIGWVFGRMVGVHSTALPGPAPAGSFSRVGGQSLTPSLGNQVK